MNPAIRGRIAAMMQMLPRAAPLENPRLHLIPLSVETIRHQPTGLPLDPFSCHSGFCFSLDVAALKF
jgi:hypothetical protein